MVELIGDQCSPSGLQVPSGAAMAQIGFLRMSGSKLEVFTTAWETVTSS